MGRPSSRARSRRRMILPLRVWGRFWTTTISRGASWTLVLLLVALLAVWASWLMTHAENAEDVQERVEEAQHELALAGAPASPGVGDPPHLHGPAGHGGPPPPHTLS